jgi:hypothetical protein
MDNDTEDQYNAEQDAKRRENEWNAQARAKMNQHPGLRERLSNTIRGKQEPEPPSQPKSAPQAAAQPPKKTMGEKLKETVDNIDKKFDNGVNVVAGKVKKELKEAYNRVPRPEIPGTKSTNGDKYTQRQRRSLEAEKNKINTERRYREEMAAYKSANKPQPRARASGYSEPRALPSYASGIYSFGAGTTAPKKQTGRSNTNYNSDNILSGNMSAISTMGSRMYYGASPPRRKTQPKTTVGSCKPCRPCKPCAAKRKPVKRKTTTRKRKSTRR